MGLWFFLSVLVVSRMLLKAYQLRLLKTSHDDASSRIRILENQLEAVKGLSKTDIERRLSALEDSVLFGDFDLKRQFKDLEHQEDARRTV